MPYTPDHSGNLPHHFTYCPTCGYKGVYYLRPNEHTDESWRCKYCGRMWLGSRGERPEGAERSA